MHKQDTRIVRAGLQQLCLPLCQVLVNHRQELNQKAKNNCGTEFYYLFLRTIPTFTMSVYYGSCNARICLWCDLWLQWLQRGGLVWGCQGQFACAAATLSPDGFWGSEPCFQPVQNTSTVVLHLISHMDVLILECAEAPELLFMLLHLKSEFQVRQFNTGIKQRCALVLLMLVH